MLAPLWARFQSAFGKPSYFFYKAARRLTSFFYFDEEEDSVYSREKKQFVGVLNWKIKDVFVTYLIEANPNVICESSAYEAADGV